MSRTSNTGENPNDKMPDGNPLKPGEVVTDDDASSAEMEREVEEELDEMDEDGDAENIDDVGAEGLPLPSDKHDAANRLGERPTPGSQNRPMTEEEKLDTSLEDTFPTSDPVPASHVDGPEVVHADRQKADRGPAERKGLSPTYDDGVEVGEDDAPLDDAGNPLNDDAGADRR